MLEEAEIPQGERTRLLRPEILLTAGSGELGNGHVTQRGKTKDRVDLLMMRRADDLVRLSATTGWEEQVTCRA